jgi:DNA-binding YbaB/EbfC family protein
LKPNSQQAQAMKQLQKMQAEMARVQDELAASEVEESVGGGAVKVTMTGDQRITKVEIDPRALDPEDVEMLQDMVVAAVNGVIVKAKDLEARRMNAIVGGLGLPGGLGF